ncbi:hypothetical protein ACWGJP_10215 [Microbacterium sp. NPDC055903]
MTVVQQIVYTAAPERWWALAEALGFVAAAPPSPEWGEFHADGILAVHRAYADRAPGRADIHLLVDDLDAAEAALSGFDVSRAEMVGVGELLTVTAGSGVAITVAAGSARTSGPISVQPIWFQSDLAEPRAVLAALGLHADIAADGGGWVEFRADAGSVGLHAGDPGIGASFEARGDLEALAARLGEAGFSASVVDEAYARTIRIADPDGGEDICVNGVQEDLYGYHREG